MMRLDKFIGSNTPYSRSDIKRLVKAKRVTIDARVVSDSGMKIDVFQQRVEVDGETVVNSGHQYMMLHKPVGYVCANTHSHHPTVLDLLKEQPSAPLTDLQIVGRLDIDTTGLVLLTTDGQWNHRVTSPVSGCKKCYRVTLEKPVDPAVAHRFSQGLMLDGEARPTLPAALEIITPTTVTLTISEGKYHQVKRMFTAVENKVVALHRQSVGAIQLDPLLAPGEFRPLTEYEVSSVA